MNTIELLERTKTRLGVDTDYKLAKALDIPDGLISYYRSGKRIPNNYAIAKFAKVLEIDPWSLVKEIEAQTEKNPTRKEFWNKAAGLFFFGLVILNMSPSPAEASQSAKILDYTVYYVKLMKKMQALKQRLLKAFKMCIPKALSCFLIMRIDHVTA